MSIICIYVNKKLDIYMWSPCRGSWEYHFFLASSNYKILHELNSIHGLFSMEFWWMACVNNTIPEV